MLIRTMRQLSSGSGLTTSCALCNLSLQRAMQDSTSDSASTVKPKMCGDAIQQGLDQFNSGNYDRALDLFTGALELPGQGFMRLSGAHICKDRHAKIAHALVAAVCSAKCVLRLWQ